MSGGYPPGDAVLPMRTRQPIPDSSRAAGRAVTGRRAEPGVPEHVIPMRMRREARHNGLARIGQVVREAGHFGAVYPGIDEQHASLALHDNGVALAELALVDQHTLRDLPQHGGPFRLRFATARRDYSRRPTQATRQVGTATPARTRGLRRPAGALQPDRTRDPTRTRVRAARQLGASPPAHELARWQASSRRAARTRRPLRSGKSSCTSFAARASAPISPPRSPSVRERLNAACLAATNSS